MKKRNLLLFSVVFTVMISASLSVPVMADYKAGNNDLLDALNAAITKIVDDGTYDTVYGHWFSGAVVLTDDSDAATATKFPTDYTEGGTLDTIIKNKEIVFGSDTAYPPFEFMDTDGKTVIGFDAEIADAIATELSTAYSVTIVAKMQSNDWDPIIPDLKSGTFDAILSAMTKTPERAQEVQFTRSYYTSKQGIVGVNATATTITAINGSGLKLGVQSGTTSDLYAQAHLTGVTVQGFTTIDLAIASLKLGDVDLVLGDLPTLAYFATQNPGDNLAVAGSFGDEELFGIATRFDTATSAKSPLPFAAIIVAFLAIPMIRKFKK